MGEELVGDRKGERARDQKDITRDSRAAPAPSPASLHPCRYAILLPLVHEPQPRSPPSVQHLQNSPRQVPKNVTVEPGSLAGQSDLSSTLAECMDKQRPDIQLTRASKMEHT